MAYGRFALLAVLVVSVTAKNITKNSPWFPWHMICSPLVNNEIIFRGQNNTPTISQKPRQQLADELYKTVVAADYEAAVIKSLHLEQDGNGQVITDTVNKLLSDGKQNVVEFAYKLWNMFGKDIVKDYFHTEFRIMFNEEKFTLTDKRYGLLTGVNKIVLEGVGRVLIGRRPEERVKFILKPIWEDNRVYFKIEDTEYGGFVRMTNIIKNEKHMVYSSPKYDTHSYQWYLRPSIYAGDLVFYIINREFNLVLKFSDRPGQYGARVMYGPDGDNTNSPLIYGWFIKLM